MEKKKIPGAWIPVCKGLARKREVLAISSATGRRRYEVVGILLEFWCWADDETGDGTLPGMHLEALPLVIAETDQAFWLAVVASGWLVQEADGLRVPNFGRWMGKSAKKRLQEAERKRQARREEEEEADTEDLGCPPDVRFLSASEADKKRPREEKRREEFGEESPNPSCPQPQKAAGGPNDNEQASSGTAPDRGDANGVNGDPGAAGEPGQLPVLVFPVVGKGPKEWPLRQGDVTEFERLFPHLDVLGECRKALAWVLAAPDRRKTARGVRKFLTGWLTRAVDYGKGRKSEGPGSRLGRLDRCEPPAGKYQGLGRQVSAKAETDAEPLLAPQQAPGNQGDRSDAAKDSQEPDPW